MNIYAKYEFTVVPDLTEVDGAVIELGNLVKIEGTYDNEGNVITEPVYSDKIAVDILYNDGVEPLAELDADRIYPKTPSHFIAGQEVCYFKCMPEEPTA